MDLLCNNITRCYHQNYNSKLQTMTCGWDRAEDCSHYIKNESISMWKEQLKKVEQCPQRQDSLVEQMYDLHRLLINSDYMMQQIQLNEDLWRNNFD